MPEPTDQNLGNAMTFEEMEQEIAAPPAPPEPKDVKLEGDKIPEPLRGKTLEDLVKQNEALTQSLRLSETERLALQNRPAPVAPVVQAAPEEEYKPATKEELAALYEENPLAAIERMQNDALHRADRHFESRFRLLEGSQLSSQENYARTEYADEFKLFGKEIQEFVSALPDKSALSTKQGWDDLVSYVRGRRGNFEKLMEYRQNGGQEPRTREVAQREQEDDSGFSARPKIRPQSPAAIGELDRTTARIAEVLGFEDPKEYIKWRDIGNKS